MNGLGLYFAIKVKHTCKWQYVLLLEVAITLIVCPLLFSPQVCANSVNFWADCRQVFGVGLAIFHTVLMIVLVMLSCIMLPTALLIYVFYVVYYKRTYLGQMDFDEEPVGP